MQGGRKARGIRSLEYFDVSAPGHCCNGSRGGDVGKGHIRGHRSAEHTSELQSHTILFGSKAAGKPGGSGAWNISMFRPPATAVMGHGAATLGKVTSAAIDRQSTRLNSSPTRFYSDLRRQESPGDQEHGIFRCFVPRPLL